MPTGETDELDDSFAHPVSRVIDELGGSAGEIGE